MSYKIDISCLNPCESKKNDPRWVREMWCWPIEMAIKMKRPKRIYSSLLPRQCLTGPLFENFVPRYLSEHHLDGSAYYKLKKALTNMAWITHHIVPLSKARLWNIDHSDEEEGIPMPWTQAPPQKKGGFKIGTVT